MNRLFIIAGACAIAFTACQKKEEFQLVSSEMPEALNGKYVYIEDVNNKVVDSVKVENKTFTYTSAIDTVNPYHLNVAEIRYVFIKEPGITTVKAGEGDGQLTLEGGRLNTMQDQMIKSTNEIVNPVRQQLQALNADSTKTDEEKAAQRDQIINDANAKMKQNINSYYTANKDNALAVLAFQMFSFDTDEEYVAMFDAAPDQVKNVDALKKHYDAIKTAEKTQPGADYADFDIKDAAGNVKKFSEFVGNDKYLLADFWASWCGPCRRAMPHLADLNKKYGPKGLRVLSIGTWDKAADNEAAIKELGMDWETVFDSESNGATAYGITGIPTMLLISPDGKIVARTHNPEEITAKIQELLK